MSLRYSSLMSSIPYLIIAILSIPIPAAKPFIEFVYQAALRTFSCNIPAPSTSIHLFLKKISISTLGSVKGK
ncbi:Uncharacterised protein [Metamycoplasma alkalescens]|uniref:Uncharacterized protein n=1 Tax=Metamycoplasma alkalescens TaxID=45363 RepID=A0A3B0P0N7_9BACT|nr:Uncharacterised protein [Metamycoplasma alkalescens]